MGYSPFTVTTHSLNDAIGFRLESDDAYTETCFEFIKDFVDKGLTFIGIPTCVNDGEPIYGKNSVFLFTRYPIKTIKIEIGIDYGQGEIGKLVYKTKTHCPWPDVPKGVHDLGLGDFLLTCTHEPHYNEDFEFYPHYKVPDVKTYYNDLEFEELN